MMPALMSLKKLKLWVMIFLKDIYNLLVGFRRIRHYPASESRELDEIRRRSLVPTDFSDHLATLFTEGMICKPKLIVELGTRGGESTFVLERVASLCQAFFVSVDIEDCSGSSAYAQWRFVKKDDIQFAAEFSAWCQKEPINPSIDLLFIDTSHKYEHTVKEINSWFPWLSPRAKVIFHDTNLRYYYFRKDGSLDFSGWKAERGVIRALEDYFQCQFQETRDFTDVRKGWRIRHQRHSNGLTILDKI
jgi:predicted O-methyltransferase YrrM